MADTLPDTCGAWRIAQSTCTREPAQNPCGVVVEGRGPGRESVVSNMDGQYIYRLYGALSEIWRVDQRLITLLFLIIHPSSAHLVERGYRGRGKQLLPTNSPITGPRDIQTCRRDSLRERSGSRSLCTSPCRIPGAASPYFPYFPYLPYLPLLTWTCCFAGSTYIGVLAWGFIPCASSSCICVPLARITCDEP